MKASVAHLARASALRKLREAAGKPLDGFHFTLDEQAAIGTLRDEGLAEWARDGPASGWMLTEAGKAVAERR